MPEFVARGLFDAGASYAAIGGGPEQLRKNLGRVIGVPPAKVPDSLMRASLASYARYWREAFRLPSMDHEKLAERLDVITEGQEYLQEALDAGRGAVCALPHSGNWDVAGVWLVHKHGAFTTVAERLSRLTESPDVRARCRAVAARFEGGDSLLETCQLIEAML